MNDKLSTLKEIPLPQPVSYYPQTIGWYILLASFLVAIVWLASRWYKKHKANRYRAEALTRLEKISADITNSEKRTQALAEIPVLIKETVLVFAPRERVASITGDQWLAFLDSTFEENRFTSGPGRILPDLAYASPNTVAKIPQQDISALISLVKQWIREHHV